MQDFDVAVIGCGILGAATTYFCAKSGLKVVCCEQFSTHEHTNGSSYGLSRCWRYAYINPNYANMMKESLKLWQNLEKESGITLINDQGGCNLVLKDSKAIQQSMLDACSETYPPNAANSYKYIDDLSNNKILKKNESTRYWSSLLNIDYLVSNNYSAVNLEKYYGTVNANQALNAFINQTKLKYSKNCTFKFNCKFKNLDIINKNDNDNSKNNSTITVHCIENEHNPTSFNCKKIIFCMGAYIASFLQKNANYPWVKPMVLGKSNAVINHVKAIPVQVVNFVSKNKENEDNGHNLMSKMPLVSDYGIKDDSLIKECKFYSMPECETTPVGKKWVLKVGNMVSDSSKDKMFNFEKNFKKIEQWVSVTFNKKLNLQLRSKGICWYAVTPKHDYIVSNCSGFIDNNNNTNNDSNEYLKDIWFVCGSGHSFKQSPMIGKYIADTICNKVTNKKNYLGIDWTFVDASLPINAQSTKKSKL